MTDAPPGVNGVAEPGKRETFAPVHDIQQLDAVWRRITDVGRHPERTAHVEGWGLALAEMVSCRSAIAARGAWTSGPSTLLGVLELDRAEVVNCRVLRWLLDPIARHGVGAAVLADLAEELGLESATPNAAQVRIEVSRPLSRADVVIEGLVDDPIVIEAKIGAAEGVRQARRLEADWPEAVALVFLTTRGVRMPWTALDPERWHGLSWNWFATHASSAMSSSPGPLDSRGIAARTAITDWINGVRRSLS